MYTDMIVEEEKKKTAEKNFSYVKNKRKSSAYWWQFRIPELERITMIHRYYGAQLRRHARGKANILELFRNALQIKRDAVNYVKLFGADASQGKMDDDDRRPRAASDH